MPNAFEAAYKQFASKKVEPAPALESTPILSFDEAFQQVSTSLPIQQSEEKPEDDRGLIDVFASGTERGAKTFRQQYNVGEYFAGADLRQTALDIAEAEREKTAITVPEAAIRMGTAKTWGDVWDALKEAPGTIIAHYFGENLPQQSVPVVGGMLGFLSPFLGGMAVGAGSGSAMVEGTASFLEGLTENGVILSDPDHVEWALQNEPLVEKIISEKAIPKAAVVGAFDTLSAGLAGKLMRGASGVASTVARGAGEVGVQASAGMAGEYFGEKAAGGEATPGSLALEGFLEIAPGGIAEVAMGTAKEVQKAREAERRQRLLRDVSDDAVTTAQMQQNEVARTQAEAQAASEEAAAVEAEQQEIEQSLSKGQLLHRNSLPVLGTRVDVNVPNEDVLTGTLADIATVTADGVGKDRATIQMDDGTTEDVFLADVVIAEHDPVLQLERKERQELQQLNEQFNRVDAAIMPGTPAATSLERAIELGEKYPDIGFVGVGNIVEQPAPQAVVEPQTDLPPFTPTHELATGEPVAQQEDGSFMLEDGTYVEDDYAAPIQQDAPVPGVTPPPVEQAQQPPAKQIASPQSAEPEATKEGEAAPQSKPDQQKDTVSDQRKIGENWEGKPVYENENGIRSYVENGVRVSESVQIGPRGEKSVDVAKRGADYLTAEEHAAQPKPVEEEEKPESKPSNARDVATSVRDHLLAPDNELKSIQQARQFVGKQTGVSIKAGTPEAKAADEAIELGVVLAAREVVEAGKAQWRNADTIYERLVDLYDRQPILGIRTSTSVKDQAYSTPVPLAYLASELAGIADGKTVYEPSAGNGALLIGTETALVHANEMNKSRADNLEAQGYHVTNNDASSYSPGSKSADVVIANPPFGVVKEGGRTKRFQIDQRYNTAEIDHAIALKALESMKDDGRAVLILGSVKETARSEEARSNAYNSKAKAEFYLTLHSQYNVTDRFTVSGDLYAKQGAGWPVDVIVIEGRGRSALELPAADVPRIYTSWDSLKEVLHHGKQQKDSSPGGQTPGTVGSSPGRGEASVDAGDGGSVRSGRADTGRGSPKNTQQRGVHDGHPDREPADRGLAESAEDAGTIADQERGRVSDADDSLTAEEIDHVFDAALEEAFSAETKQQRESSTTTVSRSAATAVEETAKGLDDVAAGLSELFGGGDPSRLGSGPTFDEKTYAKAKPLFVSGAKHFYKAGQSAADTIRLLVKVLKEQHNFSKDALARMKPYVKRFIDEVQSGAIKLAETVKEKVTPKKKSTKSATDAPREKETEGQVSYKSSSKAESFGTLVPANLQTSINDSLVELESRVGSVDDFVANELGYTRDDMQVKFGAEQIDAIALALDNFKKGSGFIIGDQTGIGKGRVVAAMIRYALKNGKTPIFVTEKPNLYADMMRDLKDIGNGDLKPLMTNNAETVPLDNGEELRTPTAAKQTKILRQMIADGNIGNHDVIFTTYNQMQTVKGAETERMRFLQRFVPGSILIFDESHNAGGGKKAGEDANQEMNRANFARMIIRQADAVFYSSATYAKRPEVMDLYYKTDMAMAIADLSKLGEAIAKGGVPMQQVVATMLARAGQYIRRERSFDSVEYDTAVEDVDVATYESVGEALRAIHAFSDHINDFTKGLDKRLKQAAKKASSSKSTGGAGAESVNFTSIMHNLVDQMLLSIKSDIAAEKAIAALKAGEKPIITVSNTNGSFIEQFAEDAGLVPGDSIGLGFQDFLLRYLEKSREVSIKEPFQQGAPEKIYLTDEDLGEDGLRAYEKAKKIIEESDLSSLPVSPIDYMQNKIREAGYTVGEITGRNATIDYKNMTFVRRSAKDTSTKGRKNVIDGFNDGAIDVLFINQAGAAGLSLHASKDFKDQRRRRMIIAQAEKNIDTHMQILGRIHRTGQVITPGYTQLVANVPAEKRPAAVLSNKMASLNANTTANRKGALMAKDVPDFMNTYGDQVAAMIMTDNPDMHSMLGSPLKQGRTGFVKEGAARKVTGRIPLMPLTFQEELYALLESEYTALIQQLDAAGENALEAKTLPLEARVQDLLQIIAPQPASRSPLAEGVNVEVMNVKRLGKPYSSAKVKEMASKAAGLESTEEDLSLILQAGQQRADETWRKMREEFGFYRDKVLDDVKTESATRGQENRLEGILRRWKENMATAPIGQGVVLETDQGNFYGIVTKIKKTGSPKNPLALGAWKVHVAVADSARQMVLPMSQLYTENTAPNEVEPGTVIINQAKEIMPGMPIINAFDEMQTMHREERTIITGNLLAGFKHVGGKGTIINFTTDDGRVRQGIIMPRGFKYGEWAKKQPVSFRNVDAIVRFIGDKTGHRAVVFTEDDGVSVKMNDGWVRIDVAKSKKKGGKYFLNQAVLNAAGGREFVSVGSNMRMELPVQEAKAVIQAIQDIGGAFQARDNLRAARIVTGSESPTFRRGPPMAGYVANRDAIEKKVAEITEKMAPQAKVATVKSIYIGGKEAGASYNDIDDLITVSLASDNPARDTVHEILHHARRQGLITDGEWKRLTQHAPEWRKKFETNKWFAEYYFKTEDDSRIRQDRLNEEAIGDAFAAWWMTGEKVPGSIRPIFNRIRRWIDAIKNKMNGMGLWSPYDIFERIASGEVGRRTKTGIPSITEMRNMAYDVPSVRRMRGTVEQEMAIQNSMHIDADSNFKGWIREKVAHAKDTLLDSSWRTQKLVDQFESIKRYESEVKGDIPVASQSAYKMARLTQNLHSVMAAVLRHGPLEYVDGNVRVRDGFEGGLEGIFQELAKNGKLHLWKGWAMANRANRLKAEGRENNMSQDEIDALLELGNEYPEFRRVLDKWQEFNKATLDFAEAAGLINDEQRATWERDDYVPFYRVMEGAGADSHRGPYKKRGVANQRSGIKRLAGADAKVGDIVENMVLNTTHLVDAAMKNIAMQRTMNVLEEGDMTSGAVLSRASRQWRRANVPMFWQPAETKARLAEVGVDWDAIPQEERQGFVQMMSMVQPKDPDVISIMVEGKAEYYRVHDPMLLSSLTLMNNTPAMHWVMRFMQGTKRVLTTGVTSFPGFMMRNFIRDSLHSWVVTGEKYVPFFGAGKGFASSLAESDELVSIMAGGGGSGGFYRTDPNDVRKLMDAKLRGSTKAWIIDSPKALWEAWRRVGQASENANRIAVYKAVMKRTGDPAEAAFQAMDLLDFSMKGDSRLVQALIMTVPFLNARMQGLYKLGRGSKGEFWKAFWLRGAIITAATMALAAANGDDERYEELPEWAKDHYYHIFFDNLASKEALEAAGINADEWHLAIPKPFEIGAIFSTFPERMDRLAAGKDDLGKTIERGRAMLRDTFAMDVPQALKPIVEQVANKDFFRDSPIEAYGEQNRQVQDRYNARTSETAKALSETFVEIGLPVSPKRIDHFVLGYLGTLGHHMMAVADLLVGPMRKAPVKPAWRLDEIPELGSFMQEHPVKTTRYVTEFYELRRDLAMAANSLRDAKRFKHDVRAKEIREQHPKVVGLSKMANKSAKQMSALSKRMKMVVDSRTMSADDKKSELTRLRTRRNAIAKRVLNRIKQVDKR